MLQVDQLGQAVGLLLGAGHGVRGVGDEVLRGLAAGHGVTGRALHADSTDLTFLPHTRCQG